MKNINIVFENSEYEQIYRIKEEHKCSWHDLILKMISYYVLTKNLEMGKIKNG